MSGYNPAARAQEHEEFFQAGYATAEREITSRICQKVDLLAERYQEHGFRLEAILMRMVSWHLIATEGRVEPDGYIGGLL